MASNNVQTPSIGRMVHYVMKSGAHRPAVIVDVLSDDMLQLQVFTDSDQTGNYNDRIPSPMWATSVMYNEEHTAHTWHWPERV